MWERGAQEPALARRPLALWLGVLAGVAALALVTAVAGGRGPVQGLGLQAATGEAGDAGEPATTPGAGDGEGTGGPAGAASPPAVREAGGGDAPGAGLPVRPEHLYTLDGSEPEAFPGELPGLAFLELDDPVSAAYAEFGPPHSQQPDINDTIAHAWSLPGGAEFVAVAAGAEPADPVLGLVAGAPPGSGVRIAAYGGVVVGRSTPAEVAEAWGPGFDRSQHPGDDYVLRYTLCRGPWPVVVKFDQPEGESWTGAPVTSVLVAYTDDDPASAGCPAP